jgi:aldose 1-epimerase
MEEYRRYSPYFGAVVGRVAGRIKDAEFELEGKMYHLEKNDGQNHLHGGKTGFSDVIWDASSFENEDEAGVEFTYFSSDGEEGYPGNLEVKVTYTLTNHNELFISYSANADKTTLLNLTNHTYFNLSGNVKRDILEHYLTMKSEAFLELNEDLTPTGQVLNVENTSFDFRKGRKIIEGVVSEDQQNILAGKGYDHPFLLSDNHQEEIILKDETSGRVLTVETDQPSVVLYTGNQIGTAYEIRGVQSKNYLGLCLETQGPPDSVHHPNLPSMILHKDETYNTATKYSFTTMNEF